MDNIFITAIKTKSYEYVRLHYKAVLQIPQRIKTDKYIKKVYDMLGDTETRQKMVDYVVENTKPENRYILSSIMDNVFELSDQTINISDKNFDILVNYGKVYKLLVYYVGIKKEINRFTFNIIMEGVIKNYLLRVTSEEDKALYKILSQNIEYFEDYVKNNVDNCNRFITIRVGIRSLSLFVKTFIKLGISLSNISEAFKFENYDYRYYIQIETAVSLVDYIVQLNSFLITPNHGLKKFRLALCEDISKLYMYPSYFHYINKERIRILFNIKFIKPVSEFDTPRMWKTNMLRCINYKKNLERVAGLIKTHSYYLLLNSNLNGTYKILDQPI